MRINKVCALPVLSLLFLASGALAETINCTPITTLPYTISASGVYCLNSDLTTDITTGAAITIDANVVTIDLNGWRLGGGLGGIDTQANGIYAHEKKNITIRNGTVRGFAVGIYLTDTAPYGESQAHLVEDVRADQNRSTGIYVIGAGSVVRNNMVSATGYPASSSAYLTAFGIFAGGYDVRVYNNEVTNIFARGTGAGFGIITMHGGRIFVQNNRISAIYADSTETRGIDITDVNNALVTDNRVIGDESNKIHIGIMFRTEVGATGKYFNNVVTGATVPYSGGTAVGGNY